ncbi:hypothetical protein F5878DRAFT_684027 [Lentinula raphanica]|uniref:Uncharacterized protein n=1 Tax=Lentinula raphanica TaxID=153919 RepID=A0AA38P8C5_9AGAR|nr:hypothetical protein F5878DRAFT_684027 [Lentinula raphanica]
MALSSAVKSLKEASALFKRDNRTADAATSTQRVVATTTSDNNVVVVDTDKKSDLTTNSDVSPPSLSASFPSLASFKDQRAFEHDRQRVKRLEEYTRAQEAKALKGGKGGSSSNSPGAAAIVTSSSEGRKKSSASGTTNSIRSTRSTRKKSRRLGSDHDTPDDKADEAYVDGVQNQKVREEFEGDRVLPSGRKDSSSSESGTGTEVKLVDLIKPTSSIRKPRKNKDTDFELIPPLRSVIVLDELAFMHDTPVRLPRDLEQEWQHVYHSESGDDSDASVSTPSYANVLTGRGRSR